MSADSDHVREGFTRQRRNLVIMSLVVLCFELLGVQFHTLNLLGNKIIIHNQHLVHLALWILLYYYLWRYFTYFNDLGDKGIINSFYSWRNPFIQPIIMERAKSSQKILSILEINQRDELSTTTFQAMQNGPMSAKGFVQCTFVNKETRQINRFEKVEFNETGLIFIIPTFRSLFHLIFRTSLFNEYLLPFVIFTLPLLFDSSSVVSWFMSVFASK